MVDKVPTPAEPAGDDEEVTSPSDDPLQDYQDAEDDAEKEFGDSFDEFADDDDSPPEEEGREDDDEEEQQIAATDKTEEAPGDKPGAKTKAAPAGAAETQDIWANATPEQRAAFEAVQHENLSHRGRLSALDRQRAAEALKASSPAAKSAAETTAEKEAVDQAAATWEKFKEEYPEVAAPMEQRFEARISKLETENERLRGEVTGISESRVQDSISQQEVALAERHPSWKTLTASKEFFDWLPNQPRYVQEGFARNGDAIIDGQEAADLLDRFVGQAPKPEPQPGGNPAAGGIGKTSLPSRRQRRLEAAVTTTGGQTGPGVGPPDDFDTAFDHFAKKAPARS